MGRPSRSDKHRNESRGSQQSRDNIRMTRNKGDMDETSIQKQLADLKESLNYMGKDLQDTKRETKQISNLIKEIGDLKDVINKKDEKIQELETRVNELEQYSKIDNVIIAGFDAPSYASVAGAKSAEEVGIINAQNQQILEDNVLKLFENVGVTVTVDDTSAIHPLPSRKPGPKPIIVKFVNRHKKQQVLAARNKLVDSEQHSYGQVYFNEHLTPHNSKLHAEARQMRRQGILEYVWVKECKVYARVTKDSQAKWIKTESDLASLRPTPTVEELSLWGESFEKLMKSQMGRKVFRDFLRLEYSEENLLFWLACEEMKEQNAESVEEKARLIYEDYISILSPKEVSLDSRVREVINRNMAEPTPNTFDEAQLQIFTLMHRDSYPRFLNSQTYKKLVQEIL